MRGRREMSERRVVLFLPSDDDEDSPRKVQILTSGHDRRACRSPPCEDGRSVSLANGKFCSGQRLSVSIVTERRDVARRNWFRREVQAESWISHEDLLTSVFEA